MSNYKSYLLRQLGLKEAKMEPSEADPKELELGIEDETPQTEDPTLAKKIAQSHLDSNSNYYSQMKGADDAKIPTFQKMMSPTAIATPVIAMAVRGSNTGGLPSGKNMAPSKLGGYEPIEPSKENSEVVNKTPVNSTITSDSPKADDSEVKDGGETHPHQTQTGVGEPPQSVTGASTDSDSALTLKSAMPKGMDIDVAEENTEDEDEYNPHKDFEKKEDGVNANIDKMEKDPNYRPAPFDKNENLTEGKHKSGCKCGFCTNKNRFGKKEDKGEEKEDDKKDKVPTERLEEVRRSLQEKAVKGKMSQTETDLLYTIKEVLVKRQNKEIISRMFTFPNGDTNERMVYQPLGEAKRKNAIFDKDQKCTHPNGFEFSGTTPNTGVKKCKMCGKVKK